MMLFDARLVAEIFSTLTCFDDYKPECAMKYTITDDRFVWVDVYKVNKEVIKRCKDEDPEKLFEHNKIMIEGEMYVIGMFEVDRILGKQIGVSLCKTPDEAFQRALAMIDPYDVEWHTIEEITDEFLEIKEKYYANKGGEKSMVKVRLTYVADSQEEQQVLDVLKEQFNVLKVSKEYKGRDGSPYSNIYIDLEVDKK